MNENIRKLNEAKNIAIASIKNFLNILNLNPDAFSHLYNIKIELGTLNKYNDEIALYIVEDNKIIIDEEHLTDSNILNIALSLTHELMHANRTIFINDGINSTKIEKLMNDISNKNLAKKHNISEYEDILNKRIKDEDKLKFSKYIPIKITPNKNNTFNVIAHNKLTKNYEEFNDIILKNIKEYTPEEIFKNIGLKLNDESNNYISNNTDLNNENSSNIICASDYYQQINEFDTIDKSNINHYINIIDKQDDFEEVMVEIISTIIIITRNKNEIDFNNIYTKLTQSDTSDIDIILALELIEILGIDILKWFMTSCYDDIYYNKFLQIAENNYFNLIYNFSYIYTQLINQKPISQVAIENIDKIKVKIYNKKSR